MEKKMMKSNGAGSRSSAMKRRRLFSAAAVLLAVCLVFVGAAGAAIEEGDVAIIGTEGYPSIQAAVEAAGDGDKILVTESHELDCISVIPEQKSLIYVDNKDITIDLNGCEVTADFTIDKLPSYSYSEVTVIRVSANAKLTMIDSSEGKGTLYVTADNGQTRVRNLLRNDNGANNNRGEEGYNLVIEGGNYLFDNGSTNTGAPSAIVYLGAYGDKTIWVKGGTFWMNNLGTGENGCPWIFNAKEKDANQIVVTGGTFNADVNHQHWEYEVYIPENLAVSNTIDAKGESWWTVVPAVASVTEYQSGYSGTYTRNVGYATIEEAVSNVGKYHDTDNNPPEQYTITLIKNADVTNTLEFDNLAKSTVFNMKDKKIIWKGGTNDDIITVSGNKLTIDSFDIIREGYTITMWNLDSQQYATLPVTENGPVEVTHSLSIAEPPKPNTYTVAFDANGASGKMDSQPFTYDKEETLTPNAFTMIGYSFDSWNTERDGSGLKYVDNAKVKNLATEGEITLYANWTANTYIVTVTQTEGGTAEASPSSAKYGEEITLTATPEEGYSFFGWITESSIDLSSNGKFMMPASPVTVKAVFKENSAEGDVAPPTSGGGGGDGGALSFPRFTENGGLVDFGSSKVVKTLMLPEGSSGSVLLKVDTVEKWPKAVETEYPFDISVEKLGDGMAYIHFEIPVSTLDRLGITSADIGVYHLVDEVWVKLAVTYEVKDGTVFYEAETDSFSPFKLVIEEGAAVPKEEETVPVIPPTETPDVPDEPEILPPIDEPTKPTEPETPAPILAVLAGLGAAVIVRRK